MDNAREIVAAIEAEYRHRKRGPFPYRDAEELQKSNPSRYRALVPDLDTYFALIAGWASSPNRLLKWKAPEINSAKGRLERGFFETYPEYAELQAKISVTDTPDLFNELAYTDNLRTLLLDLLGTLEGSTESN